MYRNADGSMKETVRFLTIVLVLFLVLDGMLCLAVWDSSRMEDWRQEVVEFRSCDYVDPDELVDYLPEWLAGVVEFLSWDDSDDDSYYRITDSEGAQWVLYPDEMDTEQFCEAVQEGDRLTIWWEETGGGNVVRAIEGYYGYEEALADWKSSAWFAAGLAAVSTGIAALAGYCLLRLRREGEAFRRKLPKWVREGY